MRATCHTNERGLAAIIVSAENQWEVDLLAKLRLEAQTETMFLDKEGCFIPSASSASAFSVLIANKEP